MTFEERCRLSEQCLPEAPYREMLTKLHNEILATLAQPEQEPCGGCGGSGWVSRDPDIGTDQECCVCEGAGVIKPQQEPVAREPNDAELLKAFTRSNNGPNPFYRCNTCGDTEPGVREYLSNHWLKHNNTSPPQRPWQGLSDEEALECWPGLAMYADCVKFWENIEAKLKEKNDN